MPAPRIFISSTCYDLSTVRAELLNFIEFMGYEPVMSENHDVPYDSHMHTYESCFQEVSSCDMVIAIIGSRFGSAINASLKNQTNIDYNKAIGNLKGRSPLTYHDFTDEFSNNGYSPSITQAEIINAVLANIPVYLFVDQKVDHERLIYKKNKNKKIYYPSIEKQETAKHIFDFINFISNHSYNNAIYPYSTTLDIKKILTKQWSMLFQKLLDAKRNKEVTKQPLIENLITKKFDELRLSILGGIDNESTQEKINLDIEYYHLVLFARSFPYLDIKKILSECETWCKLINCLGIIGIKEMKDEEEIIARPRVYIVRSNDYFRCNYSTSFIEKIENSFKTFAALSIDKKNTTINSSYKNINIEESSPFTYFEKKFPYPYDEIC